MKEEKYNEVITFVKEFTMNPELCINRNTSLDKDLAIHGLDGFEFINEFSKRFNVVIPIDFDYDKYFGQEGLDLLGIIRRFFTQSKEREFLVQITIGDLERAIDYGSLVVLEKSIELGKLE